VEKAPQSARRSEKVARRVAVRGMVATFRTPAAKHSLVLYLGGEHVSVACVNRDGRCMRKNWGGTRLKHIVFGALCPSKSGLMNKHIVKHIGCCVNISCVSYHAQATPYLHRNVPNSTEKTNNPSKKDTTKSPTRPAKSDHKKETPQVLSLGPEGALNPLESRFLACPSPCETVAYGTRYILHTHESALRGDDEMQATAPKPDRRWPVDHHLPPPLHAVCYGW
jgi:hypothetical protein